MVACCTTISPVADIELFAPEHASQSTASYIYGDTILALEEDEAGVTVTFEKELTGGSILSLEPTDFVRILVSSFFWERCRPAPGCRSFDFHYCEFARPA